MRGVGRTASKKEREHDKREKNQIKTNETLSLICLRLVIVYALL
jgi:hypothetical protein